MVSRGVVFFPPDSAGPGHGLRVQRPWALAPALRPHHRHARGGKGELDSLSRSVAPIIFPFFWVAASLRIRCSTKRGPILFFQGH